MTSTEVPGPDLRTMSPEEMAEAMYPGVVRAIDAHRRIGLPLIVWDRDAERIIRIDPDGVAGPAAGAVTEGDHVAVS